MKISTDDPRHANLEMKIAEYVNQLGGYVVRAGYHDIWPTEVVEVLRKLDDPTSTYIRTRKDFVAVFRDSQSLLIDAKTTARSVNGNGKSDFLIEVTPFATAVAMSYFSVKTLFCCQYIDFECGFFADQLAADMVNAIFFPRFRHAEQHIEECKSRFGWIFRCAEFLGCDRGGSGDPFCRIPNAKMLSMSNWRALLCEHAINHHERAKS